MRAVHTGPYYPVYILRQLIWKQVEVDRSLIHMQCSSRGYSIIVIRGGGDWCGGSRLFTHYLIKYIKEDFK